MAIKEFNKELLIKSLEKLDDYLNKHKLRNKIEIHASGGAVLLLHLEARDFTHDIDAYFPNDKKSNSILKEAIQKTAEDLDLEYTKKDQWFNNDIQDMHRESTSDIVIFEGNNIVIRSVSLEEMLSQKITTSLRTMKDIEDAKHLVNALMDKYDFSDDLSINFLTREIEKLKPMNDSTPSHILKSRVEALYESIEQNSNYPIVMEFPHDVLSKVDNKNKKKLRPRF